MTHFSFSAPRRHKVAHVGGGFTCPKCDNDKTEVKDSRAQGPHVRRRRSCPRCEHKFSTLEVPVELLALTDFREESLAVTRAMNDLVSKFNALNKSIRAAAKAKGKFDNAN